MIFVKLRRVNNNEVYLTALNGDLVLLAANKYTLPAKGSYDEYSN